MKNFRVHATVLRPTGEGVKFSDVFRAKDSQEAISLAKNKFIMIHDDLKTEFKNDESPDVHLEITGCEEL